MYYFRFALAFFLNFDHILQLNRGVDCDKYMRLLISSVTLDIVQRAYDTTIAVAVGSLSVEDSSRPPKQRFLILSKNLNSEGMLLEKSGRLPPVPFMCSSNSNYSKDFDIRNSMVRDPCVAEVIKPFATIAVCQIFDCLSPYKKGMDCDVHCTLNSKSMEDTKEDSNVNTDVRKADVEVLRELDEGLTIRVIGLSISVDARAVRQVHEIVEPVFACIFSSPVDTAFDSSQATSDGSGVRPPVIRRDEDDLSPCPRGRAVGCLVNELGNRGRRYTELIAEVEGRPCQEMVRALLMLDLRVDVITVDMLKVVLYLLFQVYSSHLPARCSHYFCILYFV